MKYIQFECLKCSISLAKLNIDVIVFYRPPPSQQNKFTASEFIDEWTDFLSHHTMSKSELVITGDANFHLELSNEHNTERFMQSLESHGLQQHIHEPTHHHGHTLDVLISRDTSNIVTDVEVHDINLCSDDGTIIQDHYAIRCTIHTPAPKSDRCMVTYRKYKHIDIDAFRQDIMSSPTLTDIHGTGDQLAQRYISGLASLIDTHAPEIQRIVTLRPHAPWYTEPIRDAKRLRRRLERIWRRWKTELARQSYRSQCVIVVREISIAKTNYYSRLIEDSKGDQKSLFKITNRLLENQQAEKLPSHDNALQLANQFGTFFQDKIQTLREHVALDGIATHLEDSPQNTDASLKYLRPTTVDEIRKIIMSRPNKACELDPIPTWLLKNCLDELLPLITNICNASLSTGYFPLEYKNAIIRPLLKRSSLDANVLSNYRPVSNLHFTSKVLEKLVVIRLEEHMSEYELYDPRQSAYRAAHSTETALMKINNDILSSLDLGRCTVLASLDLSAAFDTVDHSIFRSRLTHLYGITDTALQWFTSYLKGRDNRVCIDGSLSESRNVISGVPQGSVLGARLYTMYTRPLSDIASKHHVMFHSYADDLQVYMYCDKNEASLQRAIINLQLCISDICIWMKNNALKLNADKTEFIIFRTKEFYTDEKHLKVNDKSVKECKHVKVLGVTLDQHMTLEKHITNTCRSANMHIRKINSIRQYLSHDAVRTLVQSLVITRLDYCNSLLIGLPLRSINRLQLTHNSAARVISRTSRHTHITPILRTLHWLPIIKRSQFKILVTTFKSLHQQTPDYLSELLHWYSPRRPLRSSGTTSLVPIRHRTIFTGRRLFDTSSATLWNVLPNNIKTSESISIFKKRLKTYLFSL